MWSHPEEEEDEEEDDEEGGEENEDDDEQDEEDVEEVAEQFEPAPPTRRTPPPGAVALPFFHEVTKAYGEKDDNYEDDLGSDLAQDLIDSDGVSDLVPVGSGTSASVKAAEVWHWLEDREYSYLPAKRISSSGIILSRPLSMVPNAGS